MASQPDPWAGGNPNQGKKVQPKVVLTDKKAYRHHMLRQMLRPYCSSAFRQNHLIFVDDTSKDVGKIAGMRGKTVSTAILVDRRAANRLVALVSAIKAENAPDADDVFESPQPFNLIVFEKGGGTKKIEARIRYSVCKDDKSSRVILWHLDGASDEPISATRGKDIDNDGDDFSASDSDVDAVEMYDEDEGG